MRAAPIALLVAVVATVSVAHAQEGQVGTGEAPSLTLNAPDSVPFREAAQVEVRAVNAPGELVVRLQRVDCARIAGPVVLRELLAGGAMGVGRLVTPRRRVRYRLCARVLTADGRLLRAERVLGVR